jgi:hypothetical protein
MGYTLCALVGRADALRPIVQAVPQAVLVELGQGLRGALNAVLEALGGRATFTKEDAFDAVQLSRCWHTEEWAPD